MTIRLPNVWDTVGAVNWNEKHPEQILQGGFTTLYKQIARCLRHRRHSKRESVTSRTVLARGTTPDRLNSPPPIDIIGP